LKSYDSGDDGAARGRRGPESDVIARRALARDRSAHHLADESYSSLVIGSR
jgi:hypothetical protein